MHADFITQTEQKSNKKLAILTFRKNMSLVWWNAGIAYGCVNPTAVKCNYDIHSKTKYIKADAMNGPYVSYQSNIGSRR